MPTPERLLQKQELSKIDDSSILRKWVSRKVAMAFLGVKRGLYNDYKDKYGLKNV